MMWVFGYGSLMWRPGFTFASSHRARLPGFSRAFCRLSFRHRGTPQAPGMVMGLVPGGDCQGIAYGIAPAEEQAVLDYLDEREGNGYRRVTVPILMEQDDQEIYSLDALTYVPEPSHPTYAPGLTLARKVELLATGVGESGAARDYLTELVTQLERLGVDEPELRELMDQVRRFTGTGAPNVPDVPDKKNGGRAASGGS